PAVVGGWRGAEREPPAGWTRDGIALVLARLYPFERARWGAEAPWFASPWWPFEDGGVGGAWFRPADPTHVWASFTEQVARAITGADPGSAVAGEVVRPCRGGWRAMVSRHAHYREGEALPTIRVTLDAPRRLPKEWERPPSVLARSPLREHVRWTWLYGEERGDAVVIARQELRGRAALRDAGHAWAVVGSDTWRARVAEAVGAATPVPWVQCTAAEVLEVGPLDRRDG
ncbi:MAG: hypothetical protein FJ090_22230, partial [Deltaproteobacteria bacterium]|nr:hypothetical protein [Deltaproteobacteria bacterium]